MAATPFPVGGSSAPFDENPDRRPWFSASALAVDTDSPVIVVHGEVDMATAPELEAIVSSVIENGPKTLTLDLARTTFMDCAGASAIVMARRQLPDDCAIVVRCPRPIIRKVLEITGIDDLCQIED